MFERRNLTYLVLGFIICLAIWKITLPDSPPTYVAYQLYTSNLSYTYPTHLLPADDYNQLIDLNFTFRIVNYVCNESSPFLLVLVHSAPGNFAKRKVIRETWGENTNEIKVLFAIGATNKTLDGYLLEENKIHGDFIQGNFMDTYRNITYKHVMILKYAIYHCPHAKYILKTDDDVFVHMPAMKNFLNYDLSSYGASRVLFCTVRSNVPVLRSYRSKWRVSFKEYEEKYYPPYCPGWNLLYSPDVVFDLYKKAQKSNFFWIDDVHITGTIAQKLNILHTDIDPFVLSTKKLKKLKKKSGNITQAFLYGPADIEEETIRALWKYARTHPIPKSILRDK